LFFAAARPNYAAAMAAGDGLEKYLASLGH
jgi:hypothetical protein